MTKPVNRPPITTECPKCHRTFRASGIKVHVAYCKSDGAPAPAADDDHDDEEAPPEPAPKSARKSRSAPPAAAPPRAPSRREPFNPLPDV